MSKYLEMKFTNDDNEKMTIRLNNYDTEKSQEEIKSVMDTIISTKVFTGKEKLYDKKLSAEIVTVEKEELKLA